MEDICNLGHIWVTAKQQSAIPCTKNKVQYKIKAEIRKLSQPQGNMN